MIEWNQPLRSLPAIWREVTKPGANGVISEYERKTDGLKVTVVDYEDQFGVQKRRVTILALRTELTLKIRAMVRHYFLHDKLPTECQAAMGGRMLHIVQITGHASGASMSATPS